MGHPQFVVGLGLKELGWATRLVGPPALIHLIRAIIWREESQLAPENVEQPWYFLKLIFPKDTTRAGNLK